MKKALSFILLLSMVVPVFAMDNLYDDVSRSMEDLTESVSEVKVPEGLKSKFFGLGSSILQRGSSFKNFDKTAWARSCGSKVFGLGANMFSKVSGVVTGAIESAKNFDKNAFVESCKQEPAKPVVIAGGLLLGGYVTYAFGKVVCQKALKRIQINNFAKALMVKAESDEDFTLEWITEVAPKFLKDIDGDLKPAIKNFMNDRKGSFVTKGLITLVTEFSSAGEDSKEDSKIAVSAKIELIKKHILDCSY